MMQAIPAWYIFSREFSYIFHSIADLLFIVFGLLIVGIVSRQGWRQHLRWAYPSAIASGLTGLYRLVIDLHHYFHLGSAVNNYLASEILNTLANVVSFYSVFLMWRTFRDLSRHPASPDPVAQDLMAGVWPPPPTRTTLP